MRKDAKQTKNVILANIQGYHHTTDYSVNYAFQGFKSNKYFTSDRFIPLDEHFSRPDGKALKGYGLEIETECFGCNNHVILAEMLEKVVFDMFPSDLFKMQHDGSLGGDSSAECITQVMTKEFIRNNYSAFKSMYDKYFAGLNISCDRTGNCGMHVNISNGCFGATEKTQADAIRKLYYIVNRHYRVMCRMFNRRIDRTNYCRQMSFTGAKALDLYHMDGSHANSFNGSHYREGRIELRLVGGQSNFACFRNTMETIFFLVERVKTLTWTDCDNLEKIFAGCNKYVFDRLSRTRTEGYITNDLLENIRATINTNDDFI